MVPKGVGQRFLLDEGSTADGGDPLQVNLQGRSGGAAPVSTSELNVGQPAGGCALRLINLRHRVPLLGLMSARLKDFSANESSW